MSPETLIVETETMIATSEAPIIELQDVEVTFTSRTGSLFQPNKVHAVRGVNMRIERGQTLGIVGESGCGKSTTANVMCGLQMPTKGKVFFNGKEVTKRSAARPPRDRTRRLRGLPGPGDGPQPPHARRGPAR